VSAITLITREQDLQTICTELLAADQVAVDTEFFWERTFYPVLGLVQLATSDGRVWLIDTVAIADIRALGPVLASPTVIKLLHDAPQDLGILARATAVAPCRIFDTRLAAGFAGLDATCSLQSLLRETLAVDLPKTETRSNWLRRPLSDAQLRYAADDVLYLPKVRETLLARCADDTVRGWLADDLARLDDPAAYRERDPRQMYLRVKGYAMLAPQERAILRELAAWRETEARQRDWPRSHVLPDDTLLALARHAPTDLSALMRQPGVPHNLPPAIGKLLLAAIAEGRTLPPPVSPANGPIDDRRELKRRSDQLLEQIRVRCQPHGIDPALVASRGDAESLVQHLAAGSAESHPLTLGWRGRMTADFAP